MNHKQRRTVETAACERRYGIADEKGAEYSGQGSSYKESGADTLTNFKAVAERTGMTPVQCLLVYFLKHIDSITTTCREAEAVDYRSTGIAVDFGGEDRHDRYAEGEGIVSRLDDARNYLDLLECLLMDTGGIDDGILHQEFYERVNTPLSEEDFIEFLGDLAPDQEDVPEGSIRCYDGVIRPRTMPEGTPVQTPLFAQTTMDALRNEPLERYGAAWEAKGEVLKPRPAVFNPPSEEYGETGELS